VGDGLFLHRTGPLLRQSPGEPLYGLPKDT